VYIAKIKRPPLFGPQAIGHLEGERLDRYRCASGAVLATELS